MKLSTALVALLISAPSFAQQLIAPERNTRKVAIFDAYDGSLINDSFIDLTLGTFHASSRPLEAQVAPNGEVWVSMSFSGIQRFSNDGTTFLGQTSVQLTQAVYGFEIAYGSVWLTQSTSFSSGGGQLLELDMNLDLVATHPLPGSAMDAVAFEWNGVPGLLISDHNNNDLLFLIQLIRGTSASFIIPLGMGPVSSGLFR